MTNLALTQPLSALPTLPLVANPTSGSATLNFLEPTYPAGLSFTRASAATDFNALGQMESAAVNTPRLDYHLTTLAPRGLFIEGTRTNSIRNGDASGAVVGTLGSGGALPTFWSNNGSLGLTRQITAIGSTNGIPMVRLRYSGTANANGALAFFPDTNTNAPASTGQTWVGSCYARMVSGSMAGLNPSLSVTERNSTGTTLQTSTLPVALTGTMQRLVQSRIFTDAATAFAQIDFRVSLMNGTAYDFELELGAFQLGMGEFASSYIPSSGTATTRASDSAFATDLGILGFNPTEGTLLVEYELAGFDNALNQWVLQLDDNSTNNRLFLRQSGGAVRFEITTGGVSQASLLLEAAPSATTVYKAALAYRLNDFAACQNGGIVLTDTLGNLPMGLNRLRLGNNNTGVAPMFGWLRRVVYFNARLSDGQLQTLTQ